MLTAPMASMLTAPLACIMHVPNCFKNTALAHLHNSTDQNSNLAFYLATHLCLIRFFLHSWCKHSSFHANRSSAG